MKSSLRVIFVLAAIISIVSCGGGLTGESTGSVDSAEGQDFPEYSRVPEGTCEADFANADTGIGEVVDYQIYFASLQSRISNALALETFSFKASNGSIARNGPFITWVYEQAIKQARHSVPDRFALIDHGDRGLFRLRGVHPVVDED